MQADTNGSLSMPFDEFLDGECMDDVSVIVSSRVTGGLIGQHDHTFTLLGLDSL